MRADDLARHNIQYHRELSPLAWSNTRMLPEVRFKLLRIANKFVDYLEIPDFKILDIVLTGSMANFNYTKFSDFDIHVITDYSDLKCDDLAEAFYSAKKRIWNDQHDILIRGHEAELYVEDVKQPPVSGGVYSLMTGQWIKEPNYDPPRINDRAVNLKVHNLMIEIDKAIEYGDAADLGRIFDKIKRMRKSGLAKTGEFGVENLAFKVLRNEGYIEKLVKARTDLEDEALSLRENG